MQVSKAFFGCETENTGLLTDEAKEKLEERMRALVEGVPSSSGKGSLQTKYLANRHHCIAVDSAIKSITEVDGYNHFQAAFLPGRLLPGEKRYQLALTDLPEFLQRTSEGMRFRSAIIHEPTGMTRLEIQWGQLLPSCWDCTDHGSDAWMHKLKLYYKYLVRGSEVHDPPHKTVRNRETAVNQSEGHFIKLEFAIVLAWVRGPWGSEGNLQLLRAASREMFRNFDHRFALYRALYPQIVKSKYKGVFPAGYGTESHYEEVWFDIQFDKIIEKLGESYSPSRWKSWSDRFDYTAESFDVLLLFGLYILITRGVIASFDDVPKLRGIVGPVVAKVQLVLNHLISVRM